MGKLALYGAIAGGAEGAQTHLSNIEKTKAADADAARKERLQKLKMAHDERLAGRREKHEMKMEELKQTGRETLESMSGTNKLDVEFIRQEYAGERLGSQLEHDASEGALDRASREKIAKIDAAASSRSARNALKRYSMKTLKRGEQHPDYPGLVVETDTPVIEDPVTGSVYIPKADKLYLWDQDNPSPEPKANANQRHVDALLKNPAMADQFYNKFGYLPRDFLYVLNEAAYQSMTQGE